MILAVIEILLGFFSESISARAEFLTRFLFAMIGLTFTLKLYNTKNFLKIQAVLLLMIFSPIIFSKSTYGKEHNMQRQFSSSDLIIAMPQSFIQLDPAKMEDAYSMAINLQIFRGLFRYSPSGEIFPDLVEKWIVTPSGTDYLLTLKKMTFSDGSQIKAHHVLHSLARLFYLKSSISADLMSIKGAKDFIKSEKIEDLGIKIESDYSVKIILDQPSGIFLYQLAAVDCAILPISDFRANFLVDENTGFSGPYRMNSQRADQIELVKWRSDPLDSNNPPKSILFFSTKNNVIEMAFKKLNDSLDKHPVDEETRKKLMLEGWKESVSDLNTERMLILNPKEISKEYRDKIYSCIDPLELIKTLNNDKLIPAFGLVPTGLPGAIEVPFNKKCISTPGSKVISIPLTFTAGGVDEKIAVALREMLKKVNIAVTLIPVSRDQYISDLLGQKTSAILASKGLDYFDAYSILSYFHSGIPGNVFHIHSKLIDEKLDEAQTIVSIKERAQKYDELQKVILEQRTVVPLTFGSEASGLWSKKVASIPSHPGGMHTLPLETLSLVK